MPPKTSRASVSPSGLMQSKLSFHVTRKDGPGGAKGGKPVLTTSKSTKSRTPSTEASKTPTPIIVIDEPEQKKVKGDGGSLSRKRKFDATKVAPEDEGVMEVKDKTPPSTALKVKEGADSVSPEPEKVELAPELDPTDKRWKKLYSQAKARMGDAEPGSFLLSSVCLTKIVDVDDAYSPLEEPEQGSSYSPCV